MVRFKNRYIIAQLPKQNTLQTIQIFNDQDYINSPQQKALLTHIKSQALQFHGQLLLAKISFSLQIKYLSHGYAVIRVPRDHCQDLVASLFTSDQVRVRWVSGTIRKIHKWLFRQLRKKLKRELQQIQVNKILNIDYS